MNPADLLLGAALLVPQGESIFTAKNVGGSAGPARIVVAADRRSVDCLDALRDLSAAMDWVLAIESKPLANDLRFCRVDLNLVDQDPRIVGQLVAVAAGADIVLDAGDPAAGVRPTMHVVHRPDAVTESGRQRLRGMAAQWYRSFLADELRQDPLVETEAAQVRMNLGNLLVESGNLEDAISFYTAVYENRPDNAVPAAVLRIAECHLDLGRGQRDRDAARAQFQKAEEWARRLLDKHPGAPEAARAVVRLGEAMLGEAQSEPNDAAMRERCEQCRTELAARVMRLLDGPEMLDVWLLVGEAEFRLHRPDRVLECMLTLRESPQFGDLGDRQYLDYHFLLGYGALGQKPELAMRALEWFLIRGEADPRRGIAHVLLAQAYLEQNRYVEARAAAIEAREHHMTGLAPEWRRQALKLWARTALALGDKETAFQEMEVLVHRDDDPDLILFLADALVADHQWQRAISVARELATRAGESGDAARFKTIKALYEQARAADQLGDFPAMAVEIAPRITDPALRKQCAELVGDAYTALGRLEHAADAYRGILR